MAKEPMISCSEEAEQIGRILIAKYHPHLANARLLYLFTDQRKKRCDRVRLATAAKMTALQRFLASTLESVESGPEFLLSFDSNEWVTLSDKQMRSLVDHELEHIKPYVKSGLKWVRLPVGANIEDYVEWKLGLVDHDISEFAVIISRYGLFREEGPEQQVVDAVRQLQLPGLAVMAQSRN